MDYLERVLGWGKTQDEVDLERKRGNFSQFCFNELLIDDERHSGNVNSSCLVLSKIFIQRKTSRAFTNNFNIFSPHRAGLNSISDLIIWHQVKFLEILQTRSAAVNVRSRQFLVGRAGSSGKRPRIRLELLVVNRFGVAAALDDEFDFSYQFLHDRNLEQFNQQKS